MVENCDSFIVIHHTQMVSQIIRPPNLNSTDSLHIQSIEGLLKLDMFMAKSRRVTEIIVYEFEKTSMRPFDASPKMTFVTNIAEFNHKKNPGDEIDRIFVLLVICGVQKV